MFICRCAIRDTLRFRYERYMFHEARDFHLKTKEEKECGRNKHEARQKNYTHRNEL